MAYAWIIDARYTEADPTNGRDSAPSVAHSTDESGLPRIGRVFTSGPNGDKLAAQLANGGGMKWRTAYDVDYDGHPITHRLCYSGRYVSHDGEQGFAPGDFSEADCGTAILQYKNGHRWETL